MTRRTMKSEWPGGRGRAGLLTTVVGLLFASAVSGHAQGRVTECLKPVREIYERIGMAATGQKALTTSYSVTMRGKRKGKEFTITSHTRMSINGLRSSTISDDMEVQGDSAVNVLVVPERRTIYVVDRVAQDPGSDGLTALRKSTEAILTAASSASCAVGVDGKGRPCTTITARLNAKAQHLTGMASVTWLLSPDGGTLYTIHIDHVPGSQTQSTDVVIDSIEYRTDAIAGGGSALARFCDGRMRLLPAYKEYRLIDKRIRR
jgi:hypothetical protein